MNYIPAEVRDAAIARARVLRARAMHAFALRLWRMVRRGLRSSVWRDRPHPGTLAPGSRA